jgi:hypothetical protein
MSQMLRRCSRAVAEKDRQICVVSTGWLRRLASRGYVEKKVLERG